MMKTLYILLFILFTSGTECLSQNVQEQFAAKIAKRMGDTLDLTNVQQDKIYLINMELARKKTEIRNQATVVDIRKSIQKIENSRDSLYSTVLNYQQYQTYKQKKVTLINNN